MVDGGGGEWGIEDGDAEEWSVEVVNDGWDWDCERDELRWG